LPLLDGFGDGRTGSGSGVANGLLKIIGRRICSFSDN
jgi:hypothetical protein